MLPGFVPTACYQWVPWEQGRSGGFPYKLRIGLNKPTKRGRLDDLLEVLLTDSTPSRESLLHGEAVSRNGIFLRQHGLHTREDLRSFIQRKEKPSHDNRIGKNSSKSTRNMGILQFTSLTHHISKERIWDAYNTFPNEQHRE